MAALLLLPGFGGRYTSETFDSSSTAGADTLDCSRCSSLMIQVNATGTPTGNLDLQETINGSDWFAFPAPGANIAVADGTTVKLDITDQPFGLLRINPTDLTDGTVSVSIVGFPVQKKW